MRKKKEIGCSKPTWKSRKCRNEDFEDSHTLTTLASHGPAFLLGWFPPAATDFVWILHFQVAIIGDAAKSWPKWNFWYVYIYSSILSWRADRFRTSALYFCCITFLFEFLHQRKNIHNYGETIWCITRVCRFEWKGALFQQSCICGEIVHQIYTDSLLLGSSQQAALRVKPICFAWQAWHRVSTLRFRWYDDATVFSNLLLNLAMWQASLYMQRVSKGSIDAWFGLHASASILRYWALALKCRLYMTQWTFISTKRLDCLSVKQWA